MLAILLGTLATWTAPGQLESTAGGQTFDWPEVERQIEWHRDRSRACGPLSALYVLQQLGHRVSVSDALQRIATVDDDGMPLADVLALCHRYEPQARLVRIADKQWRRLACPCILVVNDGHHAVVLQSYSRRRKTAAVWDPADLTVKTLPLEQLRAAWSGEAILFSAFPWPSILVGSFNAMMLSALFLSQWRKWRKHRRARPAPTGTSSAKRRRRKNEQGNRK